MTAAAGSAQPAILVGVDGSEGSRDALALARMLAEVLGASLIAAAVYHRERPLRPGHEAIEAELRAAAEKALDDAVGAERPGMQRRTVAASSPARGLHELAEQTGVELLVVGSTSRGSVGRVLPGGVGERLLQESPCAVAVAPRGYASRDADVPRVVAVGYDLAEESEAALVLAAGLAGAARATIRILTVDEPRAGRYADMMSGAVAPRPAEDAREQLRAMVVRIRDALPSELRADSQILSGFPSQALLDELDKGVDLMVMGSRGYGPIGRALLGSVSGEVVRAAPCPVIIVPRAAARHSRETASDEAIAAEP